MFSFYNLKPKPQSVPSNIPVNVPPHKALLGFYETLGLPLHTEATDEEVRQVYKKIALIHHPDKSRNSDEKMKEINRANEILSDPDKKKKYIATFEHPTQIPTEEKQAQTEDFEESSKMPPGLDSEGYAPLSKKSDTQYGNAIFEKKKVAPNLSYYDPPENNYTFYELHLQRYPFEDRRGFYAPTSLQSLQARVGIQFKWKICRYRYQKSIASLFKEAGIKGYCPDSDERMFYAEWPSDAKTVDELIKFLLSLDSSMGQKTQAELQKILLEKPQQVSERLLQLVKENNIEEAFRFIAEISTTACGTNTYFHPAQFSSDLFYQLGVLLEEHNHTQDAFRAYSQVRHHSAHFDAAKNRYITHQLSLENKTDGNNTQPLNQRAEALMTYHRECHNLFSERFRRDYSSYESSVLNKKILDFIETLWLNLAEKFKQANLAQFEIDALAYIPRGATKYLEAQDKCASYYINCANQYDLLQPGSSDLRIKALEKAYIHARNDITTTDRIKRVQQIFIALSSGDPIPAFLNGATVTMEIGMATLLRQKNTENARLKLDLQIAEFSLTKIKIQQTPSVADLPVAYSVTNTEEVPTVMNLRR
ncbi:MAG: J domain-containing protein [Gammaproteobacteria bacterium]